jgi:hypothetical protein
MISRVVVVMALVIIIEESEGRKYFIRTLNTYTMHQNNKLKLCDVDGSEK